MLVSAVIMIPISIGLSFILPGVRFIPLGDLTNLMVPMSIICAAAKGNIIHSVIIGIPVVIGNLYLASALAPMFTQMAAKAEYAVADSQVFTSFLDGGQLFRGWLAELLYGNPAGQNQSQWPSGISGSITISFSIEGWIPTKSLIIISQNSE